MAWGRGCPTLHASATPGQVGATPVSPYRPGAALAKVLVLQPAIALAAPRLAPDLGRGRGLHAPRLLGVGAGILADFLHVADGLAVVLGALARRGDAAGLHRRVAHLGRDRGLDAARLFPDRPRVVLHFLLVADRLRVVLGPHRVVVSASHVLLLRLVYENGSAFTRRNGVKRQLPFPPLRLSTSTPARQAARRSRTRGGSRGGGPGWWRGTTRAAAEIAWRGSRPEAPGSPPGPHARARRRSRQASGGAATARTVSERASSRTAGAPSSASGRIA